MVPEGEEEELLEGGPGGALPPGEPEDGDAADAPLTPREAIQMLNDLLAICQGARMI
jgi:hypothetical protein